MRKFFLIVFLLASLLRLYGAWVNRDANDDHFLVIEMIAYEHRIPSKDDLACLQCYHPKLYHYSAATLVNLFSLDKENGLRIASQMLSAFAGIATVILVFFFLKALPLKEHIRLATFALVALNPALLGINIQGTNDSFVILFSTGAIFFLWRFLSEQTAKNSLLMTAFATLAALSKGSGLVVLLGTIFVLFIKILTTLSQRSLLARYTLSLIGLLMISLPCIVVFSPYDEYYRQYGSPLSINKEKSPTPHFFEETYVGGKTGITSLYHGYLTFHPLDLVQNPFLDRESEEGSYSPSRTSLWTQLYARANFIQYEGRPKDWFTKLSSPVYLIGSTIFIFALVPLFVFLMGTWGEIKKNLQGFFMRKFEFLRSTHDWVFLFFFFLFLASIIKFTYDYREFSAMKPIYIFPALLTFVFILGNGLQTTLNTLKQKYLRRGIFISCIFLLGLQVTSVTLLLIKLS